MYTGILHTHTLVVSLFIVLYLIKATLLVLNRHAALDNFVKKTKVAEMIISTLFLLTGIYLAVNTGNKGTWLWVKLFVIACTIPLAVIAFKKKNSSLALISLMALIYAYGISETKSISMKKADTAVNTEGLEGAAAGKVIFESKCQSCHGADGKLGLSGAKDLTQSALSPQEKIDIITNGKKTMAAYKDQLSQEQIAAVADYVQTLK